MIEEVVKEWTLLIGAPSDQTGRSVSTAADGSVYIAGFDHSSDYLSKYNSDGSKIWTKAVPHGTRSVNAASDGSVYVAGSTTRNLDGQINSGGSDAILSKYNSDGSKVWIRLWGGSKNDIAYSVSSDDNGSVYIAGEKEAENSGSVSIKDAFLSKYNSDGSKEWTQLIGSYYGDDYGRAIAASPDGSIYIAGITNGSLDGQRGDGLKNAFLSKYNSDGSKVWTQFLGSTSSYTYAWSVNAASDGSVYIAGWTKGDLDGQTNSGGNDAFLSKYYSDGSKEWTRLIGSLRMTRDCQLAVMIMGLLTSRVRRR